MRDRERNLTPGRWLKFVSTSINSLIRRPRSCLELGRCSDANDIVQSHCKDVRNEIVLFFDNRAGCAHVTPYQWCDHLNSSLSELYFFQSVSNNCILIV